MDFLYSDRRILVVLKPYGVLSTDEAGGMPSLVREALDDPAASVRTVHRLDRVVGGVMVLARSREAARRLSESVRTHTFHKEYLAVVNGCAPQSGTFCDLLARDKAQKRTYVTDTPGKDVRPASLSFETLAQHGGFSFVRIRLHTGRTHQIRAQFSAHGLPVAGDVKYGASAIRENEIALWSHTLTFPHPQSGETVCFTAPPPQTYPWTLFTEKSGSFANARSLIDKNPAR